MATASHPPNRQAPRLPAARGGDPVARTTPESPTHPGALARTGHVAAVTARGVGVFAVTTAKVVFMGEYAVD
ncbi:hypothetical protein [Yinghuangia seranimata]|uniref:hypothetical protein n=1 Tax=Yinghuangia seranimata TaxID=408067 RepID=UPI00248AAB09|nr:hypothetical protein [Yinghuangia seranimata]MDI2131225.1 hypothetical protein [Yinghuangia seranimata]